jgi:hypothetical protein
MHGQSFEPCQIHARPGLERLRAVESIDSGSYTRVTVGSSGGAQNATDKKAYANHFYTRLCCATLHTHFTLSLSVKLSLAIFISVAPP